MRTSVARLNAGRVEDPVAASAPAARYVRLGDIFRTVQVEENTFGRRAKRVGPSVATRNMPLRGPSTNIL